MDRLQELLSYTKQIVGIQKWREKNKGNKEIEWLALLGEVDYACEMQSIMNEGRNGKVRLQT